MSDPLSVTASIITVAALAYTSSKALYDLIASIRDAPKVFHDLNNYIEALSRVLATLRTDLDSRHRILSPNQVACLREASTIMEGCDLACRDFRTKIEGLTTHSQSDRRSFRAGFKLSFQNKAITDFRMRVVSWRESLSLALDAVLITSISDNSASLQVLRDKFTAAEVRIHNDLDMVNKRLEMLIASEREDENDQQIIIRKQRAEEQQKKTLLQCLSLCQAVADGVLQTAGHSFKHNKVSGEARAAYGDIGQLRVGSAIHVYEGNTAAERARVVMGNMDGASFLSYMK